MMIDFVKKIPAFMPLIASAISTGKVDKMQVVGALSKLSPDIENLVGIAAATIQNGGSAQDLVKNMSSVGAVSVDGRTVNSNNVANECKQAGGVGSIFGNMIEKMPNQSEQELVAVGNTLSDVNNLKSLFGTF